MNEPRAACCASGRCARRLRRRWLGALLVLCAHCSPHDVELVEHAPAADAGSDGAVAPPIPGLRAMRITPDATELTDDGRAPGERASFRAIGSFDDGDRDVSDRVGWSLEREELGKVRGGELTTAGIAGRTRVRAQAGEQKASADLTVRLELTAVLADAPEDAAELFPEDTSSDSTDEALAPRIVYPSDQTLFPRNLGRVLHQWRAPAELDLFELRFDGELTRIRYYTTATELEPDGEAFRQIAASHAGSGLALRVRGLSRAEPGTVYGSQTVNLYYSRDPVGGAIYYWSTGNEGVMRAHVSARTATKFYPDPSAKDADKCAGCHSVSRDGRRLAVGYDGERLREVGVPERNVILPATTAGAMPPEPVMMDPMMLDPMMSDPMMLDPMEMPKPPKMDPMAKEGLEYGWGTFNPGATRLLYASKGILTLIDADTGASLGKVELPEGVRATHPDWSPDGRYVAVSYGSSDKGDKNKEVLGSSLARLPVLDDGTLGEPEVLLESAGPEDTLCFPVYSPDSRYLAFARMTGKSKDNASAELFVIRADGGGEPIALPQLNRAVRDATDVTMIGNTMPTWAPNLGGDVSFLAFSSIRDYADVLVGVGRDQLWAAGFDPERIEAGEDPGYAAFWLPFQDMAEGNHRAFWALASEDECPSTAELCDGVDNDCDGIVDDECCTPGPEVCGDGIDNDCDGMPDEACGCETVEHCSNQIDDDCDQSVDEDCVL